MRTRLVVAIILIIVIAVVSIYLLIPSPLTVSDRFSFSTNSNTAYRALGKQENWDKWSPQTFHIKQKLVNTIELDVKDASGTRPVSVLLIPLSKDSVIIHWNSTFQRSSNPITRVKQYFQSHDLQQVMDNAIINFKSFVEHSENVYGIRIIETSTKDTLLAATRFSSDSFPSSQLVYNHIDKLKSYAQANGATANGFPMLNISTTDSAIFNCMVALPINKPVQNSGPIFFVRMVPGRFLATEVNGGQYTINYAHRMMDQYFKDFSRVSMAIPFEYLVTDRLKETDTTKWVTRIYGPVY